jgi:hypothetical protein
LSKAFCIAWTAARETSRRDPPPTGNGANPPVQQKLSAEESAASRAQLLDEIETLPEDDLHSRAISILKAKNRLSVADAKLVEEAFAVRMAEHEAANFDTPAPAGAGTSPSGSRTARRNFRVDTLISIRFIAHLPSQSSATARSQLGSANSWPPRSRTRGRSTATLPAWKPILPWVRPQR